MTTRSCLLPSNLYQAVREATADIGLTQDAPENLRIGEAARLWWLHGAMQVRMQCSGAGIGRSGLAVGVAYFRCHMTVMFSLVLGLLLQQLLRLPPFESDFNCFCSALYVVDYAIHFLLRHEEIRRTGQPVIKTLPTASGDIGRALMICAVTTAIGFYAFIPTTYDGVAELGLISGSGMVISLLVT
ncbi:MAG: MMPL family transporter [Burkholderiales bacterium]|nr:MMPL family transporter [Burkholderiales bacterium]